MAPMPMDDFLASHRVASLEITVALAPQQEIEFSGRKPELDPG